MIKAVIFDMDGVLLDSEPLYFQSNMRMFNRMGFGDQMTMEDYKPFTGAPAWFMWETLKKRFGTEIINQPTDELVQEERMSYLKLLKEKCERSEIVPIDGVTALLSDLCNSGYKLAIASSSDMDVINTSVDALGVREYFQELITGDYVKNGKPAPDIFLYAAEKLGVMPDECIVIEDSHNGAKGGVAAGMYVVGYYNPNSGEQDLSMTDVIIDDFNKWRP
ncbi:MAG: HAD family phosphatase [Negativicutes bacterium]